MEQKRFIVIVLIAVSLIISSCGGREEKKPETLGDNQVLVWRIAVSDEESAKNLTEVWQDTLNQLLKEKGADYTVLIKPLSTDDVDNRQAVQIAKVVKKLKDENEQTDLITLTSVTQYPDLAGYHLVYPACAKEDLLLPLDELLESEKGSILKEAIPVKELERVKLDGTTYGISAVLPAMEAVAYSKEQMEQLEITEEELAGSVFEKEELLMRVKEETGRIPYYTSGYINRQLGLWVVSPSNNLVMNQEGRFVNVTETKEFKDYLTKLAEWKGKGLVGIWGYTEENDAQIPFAQSLPEINYRMIPYTAELGVSMENGNMKKAEVFVVPDETKPVVDPYWGDQKTCIASWSKSVEKAEDFLIMLMTDPDVANLIQYGREGQEYAMNNTTLEVSSKSSICLQLFGNQYTNSLITHSTVLMEEDKLGYMEKFSKSYEAEIPDGFRFDPEPVLEQIVKTNAVFGNGYGSETEAKIMSLDIKDVDQVITDITEELKQAGMDEIVEEANRQLDEFKKN